MAKLYIIGGVVAVLVAMVLLWGILSAGARRQAAKAQQELARAEILKARAEVIHARKEGRRQGWRRVTNEPYPDALDAADDALLAILDLEANPQAAAEAEGENAMIESIGTWISLAGIGVAVLLAFAWLWPKIKTSSAVVAASQPAPLIAGVPASVAAVRAQLVQAGTYFLSEAHDHELALIQQAIHALDVKLNPPTVTQVVVSTSAATTPPAA